MKRKLLQTLLYSFLFFWTSHLFAQDIHFSQFYNSPMNLNPALTGVFAEDVRFIGNYRNQWESVPVPYLTFSGAYDTKIYSKIAPNGYFGVGGVLNYDKQGFGDLTLTQLSLTASYTHQVSDYSFLTAGFQVGTMSRGFDFDKLTFENQYNGDIFDPNLDTRENFGSTSKTFMDLGTGLNFHTQLDNGFSLNVGGALFHLTRPEQNFYDQTKSELPFRISTYAIGKAMLNEKMDIQFRLLGQFQGPYQEYLVGSAILYKISDVRGKEIYASLGTNYRYAGENDAVIPTVGVKYMMWYAEFSYDVNISQFETATNGAGGPEISVIYTITKVKPPKTFKACPIF